MANAFDFTNFDLGLSSGGGSYIRFLPSSNAWMLGKEEITLGDFTLLPETVKTGWGKMAEGQAPEWSWDDAPGKRGAQPSEDHKRGFAIKLIIDGNEVEWSSTGTGPVMGFQTLFADVIAGMANNPGKVPVVKYTNSEAHKVGKGNTRKPLFKIEKWIDKPATGAAAAFANAPALADEEF
jgi:hypothetical protein